MQHFLRGIFLKFSRRRPSRSATCADSPTVRFSALHHWHGARQCTPLTGMFETACNIAADNVCNNRRIKDGIIGNSRDRSPGEIRPDAGKSPVSDVCTLTVEDRPHPPASPSHGEAKQYLEATAWINGSEPLPYLCFLSSFCKISFVKSALPCKNIPSIINFFYMIIKWLNTFSWSTI